MGHEVEWKTHPLATNSRNIVSGIAIAIKPDRSKPKMAQREQKVDSNKATRPNLMGGLSTLGAGISLQFAARVEQGAVSLTAPPKTITNASRRSIPCAPLLVLPLWSGQSSAQPPSWEAAMKHDPDMCCICMRLGTSTHRVPLCRVSQASRHQQIRRNVFRQE